MKKILANYYYFVKIKTLQFSENLISVYENKIVGYIAYYLGFILSPIELFLKKRGFLFIRPMVAGPGEFLPAIDIFIKRLEKKNSFSKKKIIFIQKKKDSFIFLKKNFKNYFYKIFINNLLYYICLPFLIRNSRIILDINVGRSRWNIKYFNKKNKCNFFFRESYLSVKKIHKKREFLNKYDKLHGIKKNYFLDDYILKNINLKKKIVLVHIKFDVRNSNAIPLDPFTYIDLLNYLKLNNYFIILIGRDKCPLQFKNYVDFNYAESVHANLEHDLGLINLSYASIFNSSGISWASTLMDKPFLYLNSWHNFVFPGVGKCIDVPCLINYKNKELSFKEQQMYYLNILKNESTDTFKNNNFYARNASSDEIIEGFKELEKLINGNFNLTERQNNVNKIIEKQNIFCTKKCILSDYFIKKHISRL